MMMVFLVGLCFGGGGGGSVAGDVGVVVFGRFGCAVAVFPVPPGLF